MEQVGIVLQFISVLLYLIPVFMAWRVSKYGKGYLPQWKNAWHWTVMFSVSVVILRLWRAVYMYQKVVNEPLSITLASLVISIIWLVANYKFYKLFKNGH